MTVAEIRDEAGLDRLQADWTALLAQCPDRVIFRTWEWVRDWWSAYGNPGELRILTAHDDAGVLQGIAPLRVRMEHRYGQTVQALAFIGDASSYSDSDYLDFIIAPGSEGAVLRAFHRHWTPELERGAVLLLHEIPEQSANLPVLRELTAASGMNAAEVSVPCASVGLPSTWDEYLGMVKPRFRTKIRSVLRTLEGRGDIEFGFCDNPRDLEDLLPALFDLHTRRWQAEGQPGVFGGSKKRDFYARLSATLLDRGWLRFSWLRWNGRILACQYGFVYEGVYSQLQEGYEPASEHWNVGIGLRAWSIRELQREGVRHYDFLGGIGRHKTDWGGQVKQSQRLLLGHTTPRNTLFLKGPEWEVAVKDSLRKVLPERVIEARQTLKSNLRGSADMAAGKEWVRGAGAACYFHSGLPQWTRGLRDRYQLTVEPNGVLPKVSWKKRTEGSTRILYYHRVNNDGDPFFGAISTSLFEEQMRYVARHYKVVSLSEAVERMQEGRTPENLVAVTFDDGYQDNYLNAFPILQRYNVPATIFLTTGCLDSGDPLWFEQLAEALKKTAREFHDLEMDLPRRFWLRTEAERLESNRQLGDLLRGMEDRERRRWLADILAQLGPVELTERRNKMLTWDQVRLMKAHQIDFGGHTVTHPFLSKQSPAEASWEISECKRRIEAELQQEIGYFAYPNGREQDFAGSNKELLRAAGYRGAVTTIWGMNYRSTDPMELRRGGPWEKSAALFAYKLDWYQLANL